MNIWIISGFQIEVAFPIGWNFGNIVRYKFREYENVLLNWNMRKQKHIFIYIVNIEQGFFPNAVDKKIYSLKCYFFKFVVFLFYNKISM